MSTSSVMHPKHFVDSHSSVLHELPAIALRILLRVLVILMLVPVLLLYAGTAVPWVFMLLVLAIDGVLLWRLFRRTSTVGREFLLMVAVAFVATVAVMLWQSYAETPRLVDTLQKQFANALVNKVLP